MNKTEQLKRGGPNPDLGVSMCSITKFNKIPKARERTEFMAKYENSLKHSVDLFLLPGEDLGESLSVSKIYCLIRAANLQAKKVACSLHTPDIRFETLPALPPDARSLE